MQSSAPVVCSDWVPALSSLLSLSSPPALGIQQLCTLEITLGNMHNLFCSLHKCIVHTNTVYCTWHCTWYVACWIEPCAIGRVFCGVLCWQNTPSTICKNSVGNTSQVSGKGGFNTGLSTTSINISKEETEAPAFRQWLLHNVCRNFIASYILM